MDDNITFTDNSIILLSGEEIPAFPKAERMEAVKSSNGFQLDESGEFLASVDMGCNLAYTGTSGLEWANLRVWIEWWNELEQCQSGKDGNELMVVYFAGSPLSGQNSYTAVNERGEESRVSFGEFKPLWKTFAEVNKRYFEAAQRFESYSLEKVPHRLGII